ncbi:MAG: NAD-dependent epimerase/dehydratase family protein [Candidatus Nanohaloarchaeota archaeon QJJ-7]|nr:NAD-dependent epimerase/dehydratase family protein [Candidatus Nanohaloarchaeota archaeon QJJ-7]
MNVTVAGSNGFIGKHLVERLQEEHHVTGLDLHPSPHADQSVTADATENVPEEAVEDTETLYYFLHGLSGSDVVETEKEMARNVREACDATGVDRIIYLGGILPEEPDSEHLKGRQVTEEELGKANGDLTAFRAGMVVGEGSASFNIMSQLVKRLPFMVSPPWLENRNQPVHVDDAMTYLVKALEEPETRNESLDIGGSTLLTYREAMETVAEVLGKNLFFVPAPFLTPRISAFGLRIVTDVDYPVARSLAESLSEEMVPGDTAEQLLQVKPIGFREAVEREIG